MCSGEVNSTNGSGENSSTTDTSKISSTTQTSVEIAEVEDSGIPPVVLFVCGAFLSLLVCASLVVFVRYGRDLARSYSSASLASRNKGVSREPSTASLAKKANMVTRETSTTSLTKDNVEDALEKGLCKDAGEPCKGKVHGAVAEQKMGDAAVVDKISDQKPSASTQDLGSSAVQSEPEQDEVSGESSSVMLNAGAVSEWSTASVAAEQDSEALKGLSDFMAEARPKDIMFLTTGTGNRTANPSPGDDARISYKI
jgi:hypothetical protein